MAKRRSSRGATFIGLSRQVSSEQKAIWHNVTGAGPRGVIREFFDVNADEQQECATTLERLIQTRIDAQQ